MFERLSFEDSSKNLKFYEEYGDTKPNWHYMRATTTKLSGEWFASISLQPSDMSSTLSIFLTMVCLSTWAAATVRLAEEIERINARIDEL